MNLEKCIRKAFTSLVLLLATSGMIKAQDYSSSIGLRGGSGYGVTAKHFIKDGVALEGILNSRWSGFNITGLYEWHTEAFNTSGLYWFYGAGAHIGFWDGDNVPWLNDSAAYTIIGLDLIGGIEYKLQELPITISLDWKPAINLVGSTGFWGDNGAFSVRYTF